MILICLLVVLGAVLLQASLASLTIFGALPLIALLVICWLSLRYGANLALPLTIISGVLLSFFALAPVEVILAYVIGGVVLSIAIYTEDKSTELSLSSSLLTIGLAAFFVTIISGISSLSGLGLGLFLVYIFMTVLLTSIVWSLMFSVARPR